MDDSHILSAFQEMGGPSSPRPRVPAPARATLVFDACQLGVVLRALLFVEAAGAVAVLFGAVSVLDWLMRLAVVSAAVIPGCLGWLLTACSLKHRLAQLPPLAQRLAGIALGGLAGLFGCWIVSRVGFGFEAPWLASASAGGLLAAMVVLALEMRAKGRMPAATTARLAELQARIRPHFLFNSLNSAIALVREDPARAEALLEDLSELFRHALMERAEAVSLGEEIALARHYLAIEQVRFGDRLQVEWALDPQADAARVPPLCLQPLVENAVKHGVEPSASGAAVKISTQRRGSVVVVKVTNTVPAGQGVPGHGVAQQNVRDRLQLLHDVQGQFQAASRDGIYQVRMEIPA